MSSHGMRKKSSTGKRPGGRTADVSRRIFAATQDLLLERGIEAVTFQEVAQRAGVGRATLYRRWASPALLVEEAVLQATSDQILIPDTGSLREDLVAILEQIGEFISGPLGSAALIAALTLRQQVEPIEQSKLWAVRQLDVAPIFARAIERGEIASDFDEEAFFASAAGAVYFRHLIMGEAITREWIERVMDGLLGRGRP